MDDYSRALCYPKRIAAEKLSILSLFPENAHKYDERNNGYPGH